VGSREADPDPANVEMTPDAEIDLTRCPNISTMKILPKEFCHIPDGLLIEAVVAWPPSPVDDAIPVPVTVPKVYEITDDTAGIEDGNKVGEIELDFVGNVSRTLFPMFSEMKTVPTAFPHTPQGWFRAVEVAGSPSGPVDASPVPAIV
jgi:hypothetical protein